MKQSVLFIFLCVLFFSNCTQQKENEAHILERNLTSVTFIDDDQLNDPTFLCITNKELLITNQQADTIIDAFNLNGKRTGQFLKRGEGPDEGLFVIRLQYDANQNCVYAPDANKNVLFKLTDIGSSRPQIERMVSFPTDTVGQALTYNWWGYLKNNQIVAGNATPKGMYAVYTSDGKVVKFSTPYPDKNQTDERLTDWANIMLYKPFGAVSPSGDKAVITNNISDMLSLVTLSEDKNVHIETQVKAVPNDIYIIQTGENFVQGAWTSKTIRYTTDIICTDNDIYALYAGIPLEEVTKNNYQVRNVNVYDWSGKLHTKLILDKPVRAITVSLDGKNLYAIHESSTGYSVLKYEL